MVRKMARPRRLDSVRLRGGGGLAAGRWQLGSAAQGKWWLGWAARDTGGEPRRRRMAGVGQNRCSGPRFDSGFGRGSRASDGEDDGSVGEGVRDRALGAPRRRAAVGGELAGSGALVLGFVRKEAEGEMAHAKNGLDEVRQQPERCAPRHPAALLGGACSGE